MISRSLSFSIVFGLMRQRQSDDDDGIVHSEGESLLRGERKETRKKQASSKWWHRGERGTLRRMAKRPLVTNPKFRPNRRESVLGMRSCHSEEDCEEASATSL